MRRFLTEVLVFGIALSACSRNVGDTAPREFTGVWLYEFEGSTFIEGATRIPSKRPAYMKAAWLDYHPDQQRPGQFVELSDKDSYDERRRCYLIYPFIVTFIGRRTINPHGSGHMGLWASEVKPDRMISSKPLGRPFCYGS